MFFNLRDVPGLKKKPSTSELLDWLKLLLAEDIPPEALRSADRKAFIPPLHGALLKNEQDVHLFERVVFMARRRRALIVTGASSSRSRCAARTRRSSRSRASTMPTRSRRRPRDGELWRLWYTRVPAPDKMAAWLDAALDMRERAGRDAVRRARQRERRHRRQHALLQRRRRQPPARDRPHVVREARAAHGAQHRVQAAAADARVRNARAASPSSSARTGSTTRRARRSRGSARSRTACCATTSSCPTGRGATPSCSASSTANGRR